MFSRAQEPATAAPGGLEMVFFDPDEPQALLRFLPSSAQAA